MRPGLLLSRNMESEMKERTLHVLSTGDVRRALPMADAIEAVKAAFVELSAGQAQMPQRTGLQTAGGDATFLVMPALLDREKRMGVKILSLVPGNEKRALPLIQALMVLFDGKTGAPLAAMDAGLMTAIRTGAASGAATDALARAGARSAAVFGAGVQGRTQLEAVRCVRPLDRAVVFDRDPAAAAAFAEEMEQRLQLPVSAAGTPRDALQGADVVCTATTASAPVFDDADLEPGVHINAVGAYTPESREIPGETVERARVVVDHSAACLEEAGDILIPMAEGRIGKDHIRAELGAVLSGNEPGRESDGEVTLFKSVGVAVQDAAVAFRALESAMKLGLGQTVAL